MLEAGGPQHRPGQAPVDGVLRRHRTDTAAAGDDHLVVRHQAVYVSDTPAHRAQDLTTTLAEVIRHVPGHTAGAEVGVHHPLPGDLLKQVLDYLPIAEGIHEGGTEHADVRAEGAHEHVVAGDAVQLRQDDADVVGPLRRFDAGQLLHGQHVAELGVELGQVIGAVLIADRLAVVAVLGQLLSAAVHVADDRVHVHHLLAIDGEHHSEHAVGSRVLRPHVDVDVYRLQVFSRRDAVLRGHLTFPTPA